VAKADRIKNVKRGSTGISRKSFPLENEAIKKHVAWVKKQK
jgi:hypothetical protein